MSVDLEKIQKEIDRLKRESHQDTKDLCNIFTSLNALRHRLNQHEEVLRDFNERFWDLLIIFCPELRTKESNTELFSATH